MTAPKPGLPARSGLRAFVETLADIARLLDVFGRTRLMYGILRFWPARSEIGHDVARLNPSKAVVILPVYEDDVVVEKARNMRRDETPETVATDIIRRVLRVAA